MNSHLPFRIRFVKSIMRNWPIARGKGLIYRLLLRDYSKWPKTADIDFDYGRFINASLKPWPYGFRELFLKGIMDEVEMSVWIALLHKGDVVIDGGANWGYWTLVAAKMVGPEGSVFAFEPIPVTAKALKRNVEASPYKNVTVVEAALWANSGRTKLHLPDNDPFLGNASIGKSKDLIWIDEVECPTVSIDEFIATKGIKPTLIKLDIEGSELFALRSSQRFLSSDNPPLIYFEWNEKTCFALGYHPQKTLDYLDSLGYVPYLAKKNGLVPFVVNSEITDWSPMVWCFKSGEMYNRALRAGLIEGNNNL